jgi:lysophospholipid acyltransferase (LPLAT)-like uncharacterized protein
MTIAMKLRHPWLIPILAVLGSLLIRLWMSMVRFRFDYSRPGEPHPPHWRRKRFVYGFWHESLLFGVSFRTKFVNRVTTLVSQHADGELITQICRRLGLDIVRGSTTRGGGQGLLDLVHASRRTHVVVTPDGPRGPRRRVQPGIVYLASRCGSPLVPVGMGYTRARRANSWDRFALPWPGSTACCVIGAPISIPPDLDRRTLEQYRRLFEDRLHEVTEAAERWASGGSPRRISEAPALRESA